MPMGRELARQSRTALQILGHVKEGTKQALAIAYYVMPNAPQFNICEIGEAVRRERGGAFDEKRNVITDLVKAGCAAVARQFELRGHQVFVLTLTPGGRKAGQDRGVFLPAWVRGSEGPADASEVVFST